MDLLLLLLIIVAVVAVSGWGYGTVAHRPAAGGTEVVAAPVWVNPMGIIAAIAVVGILMMLITGWRPFVAM